MLTNTAMLPGANGLRHLEKFLPAGEGVMVGHNKLFGTLGYQLVNDRLCVSVVGADRTSTLEYLTERFAHHDANILSCFGEKLATGQGCYFELAADPDDLQRLFEDLCSANAADLTQRLKLPVPVERRLGLRVLLDRDNKGVLHQVAQVLSNLNINLSYFRADTEEPSLLGEQLVEDGVIAAFTDEYCVDLLAHLESPAGVDEQDMLRQVVNSFDSKVLAVLWDLPWNREGLGSVKGRKLRILKK